MNNKVKILILDVVFHHNGGDGITLCNLFDYFKKEELFNAASKKSLESSDRDKCISYYQFGEKEYEFLLPSFIRKFLPNSFLNNTDKSTIRSFDSIVSFSNNSGSKKRNNKFLILSIKLLQLFFNIIGLYPILIKRYPSKEFLQWIDLHKPDYIYTQLSNIQTIRFVNALVNLTKIPLVIHIMDDWPSTYARKGLLYVYWKNKINNEFGELVQKASICLSISEGMSIEYKKRYNKEFIPFHNPVDVDWWKQHKKTDFSIGNKIKLSYFGRIGIGTHNALLQVIKVIDALRKEGLDIVLHMHVPSKDQVYFSKHVKRGVVVYNPFVPHNKIPEVISQADILLFPLLANPNIFSARELKFIRYSMPTKATEYMLSGTPILLFCSDSIFLHQHAKQNNWAYIINNSNIEFLKERIKYFINNKELRKTISENAFKFALDNYDSKKVKYQFYKIFQKGNV